MYAPILNFLSDGAPHKRKEIKDSSPKNGVQSAQTWMKSIMLDRPKRC